MCAPPAARPPQETGQDDATEPDRIEITAGQVDLSSEE